MLACKTTAHLLSGPPPPKPLDRFRYLMPSETIPFSATPPHRSGWQRSAPEIGLAGLALLLFFAVCHRVLQTPLWSFNGARLMPSVALGGGIDFYVLLPPGGPLYSVVYGPMFAIVYLPATLFSSPNSAVLAGAAITVILCFSAAAFMHFTPLRSGGGRIDALAFLTAGLLMCFLEPLKYSCFNVHADGPGLAFGGMACAALYSSGLDKRRVALPASALCAVFAIFCKQMFLPVPAALVVYLWVATGGARAVRYLLWLDVAGALATAAALYLAGPARLYHCLIWLPAHHPWDLVSALQATRNFILLSMPVPVLLLACAVYLCTAPQLRGSMLRVLATNRAAPLLLVGVALLPFSIAGRAKAGGDINSLSFALFFLACGLTVMLADVAHDAESGSTRRLAVSVLVAIALPLALFEAPLVFDIRASVQRLPQAEQQVVFEYLNRHPGAAYFPWFPLAHYCAEHRFYHYSYGIVERLLAGEPVSMADFRAYIPPNPRVVAFGADGSPRLLGYDLMQYMPEYTYPVHDPELPGWLVYGKAPR